MKRFSKSRNELLKAWVVNFNGNIDKYADVTAFAVVFLSPQFLKSVCLMSLKRWG